LWTRHNIAITSTPSLVKVSFLRDSFTEIWEKPPINGYVAFCLRLDG